MPVAAWRMSVAGPRRNRLLLLRDLLPHDVGSYSRAASRCRTQTAHQLTAALGPTDPPRFPDPLINRDELLSLIIMPAAGKTRLTITNA